MKPTSIIILTLLSALLLSACGGATEESNSANTANHAPDISGVPRTSIETGVEYVFTPLAADLDGDSLTFSIQNKPNWVSFDPSNGMLSGTPGINDVGTHANITIAVSDNSQTTTLLPFSIEVVNHSDVQNVISQISTGMDDVEESADSVMYVDSSDLELVNDSNNQLIGLRFSLNVPKSAIVTEANLRFTVDEVTLEETNLVIWAEASDDAAAFSTANGSISGRTSSVATSTWSPTPWHNIGESLAAQTSSNLSGLIQEIVNRPGWNPRNHLVLVITGTGVRTAVSYEGDPGNAPLLSVKYSTDSSNHSPQIQGSPDTGATIGIPYSFTPTASDPDGDSLSFSISTLPAWANFNSANGMLSGTPDSGDVGTYNNIQISVSDGENSASLAAFSIIVSDTNHSPTISGTPSSSVSELSGYSFTPIASDPDADNLLFSVSNIPNWCTFNVADGSLTGTPGYSDSGIYSNIVISVSDGTASTSLPPFSISVLNNNRSPSISGTPASSVEEVSAYSFIPDVTDPDGDSLVFSADNLPVWASFDTNTGVLSGIPDYDSAGTYNNILISVSDGSASDSVPAFSITVNDVNRSPTISGQPLNAVVVDASYSFTPIADDPDGDDISFSVTNLPSWANFNTSTGSLTGIPGTGDTGTYSNILISVTDTHETSSLGAFEISVTDEVTNPTDEIFVDSSIGSNYCSDYSESSRSCGSGNQEAYKSLSSAASSAIAGDTVAIRVGTYNEQLAPQNSGSASSPITFKNHNGEKVIISGTSLSPAIVITDRNYLVLEGLEIANVNRWMYAVNSHHNIIRNNVFSGAHDSGGSSKTGLFFQEATFNKVIDNIIDGSTQDNISLIKSDNNLISGNTLTNADHALWTIKCGNKNVLRDNYFHNSAQKIGEVYDCDDVGFNHEYFIHDATKYNVIEKNVFAKTSTYYSPSGGNGIQYAGQNGIIRFNVFFDNNVGIGMQNYSPEALYNKHNRIYHNTFVNNHCGGISTSNPSSSHYIDNIFVNNLLYKNVECSGTDPYQFMYRSGLEGFKLINNNLSSGTIPDNVIGAWGGSGDSLSWYEVNYPGFFVDNLERDPGFKSESTNDFSLRPDSAMIDAGSFLTTTTNTGSGTVITVDNAGYFYDGFGINEELGDLIQLESSSETLRIISVNYSNNQITVDKNTSWDSGQGITFKYQGNKPDIGAFEVY